MTETLQLEEAIQLHDAPRLLIEWSSPWREFPSSIRPALARSSARLAGETPYGLVPYRFMLTALAVEAFLLFVAIVLPMKIAQMRPYVAPKLASHEVIYYSGDELPRTDDLGGSQSGATGRAGGNEAHHRTQTIRIARGGSLVERVVDAPNLQLPASRDAVANLLAIKPNPGPPPLEGVRSSRPALTLPAAVVAPAPTLTRDYTRGMQSLQPVIPPAPSVTRDQPLTAPTLNAAVIPPAPTLSHEPALVAPRLDSSVVAPAPNLAREKARPAPALTGAIIPPAPSASSPQISRSPVQMTSVAVVPPPVSAPERETSRTSKLNMPSPSVIAPPPSADVSPDLRRLAAGSVSDSSKTVIAPPPSQAGSGLMSSLIGKIFGTTDVVPPPPAVGGGSVSGSSRGAPGGTGTAIGSNVVAPPPSVSGGTTPGRSGGASMAGSLTTGVVPPPPSLSGSGRGTGEATGASGGPGGTLLAGNVIPPPPSVGGGSSLTGSGRGAKGTGLGGTLDSGAVLAPPANGGSGGGSGVVLSSQPGSKVGMPGNASVGSLALSPAGGDKPGLGGAGGGSSIGHGKDTGSGLTGTGPGAGRNGEGRGSDPNAHGGISPTAGPGGAGSGTTGTPAVPGVSISGGSTAIITLPSFGSGGASSPTVPGRSSVKAQTGPAITIVATARSGGAFNRYGELPGDNYTIYFDTPFGPAAMQFADPTSTGHSGDLTGPQPLRAELPTGLPRTQVVVRCEIDASGNLKIVSLLESGPSDVTVKILAALSKWKFRPAMRGDQPVEVNTILGFNTNTDDKF